MDSKESKEPKPKEGRGFILRPVYFISLGFVGIILFGSFLLSTPIAHADGNWGNYMDALFTSTSAVCVTGLAVLDPGVELNLFGQLVLLVLIQLGGLGFMTLASLLFMAIGKKITLKERLALQEAYNQNELQGMVKLARSIVLMTLIIEATGAVLFTFRFVPLFGWGRGIYYSVFHAVSSFCNAGFDLFGRHYGEFASLVPMRADVLVNVVTMLLVTLGGMGFTVINDVLRSRRLSRMMVHTKVVLLATAILFVFGTVFFSLSEWNNAGTMGGLNPGQKIMAAMFQTVTPRTAGFATVDQGALTAGGRLMTMFYMFVGASPAGTGGGVKTTTFLVVVLLLVAGAKGESEARVSGRSIQRRSAIKSAAILLFAAAVIGLAVLVVSVAEIDILGKSMSVENVLFECISAFSTVGLSMGITPSLSTASELTLCVVMLIGRLGTIALGLIAFSKKENLNIKYPDAKILVG